MNAHVSQQSLQYFGILNGVTYRIDPSSGVAIERMFGFDPAKVPERRSDNEPSPDVTSAPATANPTPAIVSADGAEHFDAERIEPPSNLFPRSGGEALRAGHPDLWALLVAGTCLEGTAFTSA